MASRGEALGTAIGKGMHYSLRYVAAPGLAFKTGFEQETGTDLSLAVELALLAGPTVTQIGLQALIGAFYKSTAKRVRRLYRESVYARLNPTTGEAEHRVRDRRERLLSSIDERLSPRNMYSSGAEQALLEVEEKAKRMNITRKTAKTGMVTGGFAAAGYCLGRLAGKLVTN